MKIGYDINGFQLVARDFLVEIKLREVDREVKRSWSERLFTLPWQPLKTTKLVQVMEQYTVPSRQIIADQVNRVIYAHPEMIKEIKAAIPEITAAVPAHRARFDFNF